jgi:hypothetical protein
MSGTISLLILYAFMLCRETTVPLITDVGADKQGEQE